MKRLSDGTAKGFDVRISRRIARKVKKVLRDNLGHGCVARVADGGFRGIAHRLMLIELVSARLQVSSIFRLLLRQQR
uniref:ClpB_D2-small domain-containing protein n=1 Tax=Ascaris lumbricoides TaxID=6252 RepID=A0A0M3I7A6_ASCLU